MIKTLKFLKFLLILIVLTVGTWYLAEGLLWLQFTMKPFTPIGMVIETWGVHILFVLLSVAWAVLLNVN